ncbi:efflux transporter outer membrane subunit [Telmatospirillum sp.]|uniref:efflux transporter outer membrane subunit n=1 Tax=Telmatospirillum sp. TaxID=2079197 RepID=UPI00283F9E17|nr:efflux transporter outer membrane subunit [Telmatospirillum sp.]MDR3438893.1 efflux transporter outer membrane subunit [Telmatospirillum sp.]
MFRTLIALSTATALLSGCTLIPDSLRPDQPVPNSWPQGPAYKTEVSAETGKSLWGDIGWQDFFTDPVLRHLIQQSLDNNRDLRVAALNIEVAQASYRVTRADLLPNVSAGVSETQKLTPRQLSSTVPQKAVTTRNYGANLGVTSFELDLFGRLRSLEEQALEKYLATEEARTSTQISLVAEVANAYLTLLGDRKLLALTEETLQSRERSLELISRSFERGVDSRLDVAQARSTVETARTNRATYLRLVDQDKNALVLLVGAPVDDSELNAGNLDTMRFVEDLPVGLPSEVLLRRPDIVEAEHTLNASNANIGAARAAFFPTVSLTATGGYASPTLSNLFQAGSGAWTFAPQITVPVFDAGRNQANLDSAKASRDIAVAQYEKAIQSAFREVADALAAKGTWTDQMISQNALVEATSDSYRLSKARYDRGVDSYLTVLDSQRSLYSAQQDLVSVQVSRLSNLVTLYKVLGGGRS